MKYLSKIRQKIDNFHDYGQKFLKLELILFMMDFHKKL